MGDLRTHRRGTCPIGATPSDPSASTAAGLRASLGSWSAYLSHAYVDLLREHGLEMSNSAKGNPYHNAVVERFMRTIEQEEVYLSNYETYLDVIENLPTFIEEVYNEKRVHSGIGYLTASELEKQLTGDPASVSRIELRL